MQRAIRFLLYLGVVQSFLVCSCSLPSDSETAKWEMYVEVPVVEKKFMAKDLLPEELSEGLKLNYGDSTGLNDTITLVKEDTLTYTMQRELISTDTSILEEKMGAVTLKNTPPIDLKFNLITADNSNPSVLLPASLSVNQSQEKILDGIVSVTIDETSPPLQITITNTAALADIHNVTVTLSSGGTIVAAVTTPLISANTAQVAEVGMADKTVFTTITVSVEATIPIGSTVNAQDGLGVAFSLDNQIASDAVIVDSMITYSDLFTGNIQLADGIMLDAIDLDDATLKCEVTNPASIRVFLDAVIDDSWERTYVQNLSIESNKQLATATDSNYFTGKIIADTLFKSVAETNFSFPVSLNGMRVFPDWDADSSKSILKYQYRITSIPDGRNIHFNKDLVIIFKLIPEQFPFIRLKGTLIDPIEESFSSQQGIGFDWKASILDSLKKHFQFQEAEMTFEFKPDLPPQSTIDTLKMHVALTSNSNPSDSTILDKTIIRINADSLYSQKQIITNLLNSWPDTISFKSQVTVPDMTPLTLYNVKDSNNRYRNTLDIGVKVRWKLRIPLSWQIIGTMATELEMSSIELGLEDLEWINKLREKRVQLNLEAKNNTLINVVLHAVCASKKYSSELSAFPGNLIYIGNIEQYLGAHLFTLFGKNGLELPSRGKESTATVLLDERGLEALLADEKVQIRWFLVMPASPPDAFTSNDYLNLKASASVEGIGRTDSLMNWED
ncbi:MAG: hypothetical protein JW915_15285 [Chitinispirillaceae bacterium]|nr:hypothetical protein [Chitinispirillaceae bacterium]